MNSRIFLLGDSTLDNFSWIDATNKEKCITTHLHELMPDKTIINLARDCFTTKNVLDGSYLNSLNIHQQDYETLEALPGFPRGMPGQFVKPLEELNQHSYNPNKGDKIILSIGGNDIREVLGNPTGLTTALDNLEKNYKKILDKIFEKYPNAELTIMTQYYPDINNDSVYGVYKFMSIIASATGLTKTQLLHQLLNQLYNKIFNYCLDKKYKLKVVDVTSSLNPYNSSNFRSQIEPSHTGGGKIAKMLSYALSAHTTVSEIYRFKDSGCYHRKHQLTAGLDYQFKSIDDFRVTPEESSKTTDSVTYKTFSKTSTSHIDIKNPETKETSFNTQSEGQSIKKTPSANQFKINKILKISGITILVCVFITASGAACLYFIAPNLLKLAAYTASITSMASMAYSKSSSELNSSLFFYNYNKTKEESENNNYEKLRSLQL